MDDEPNLDDTPPTKRMKISPPVHLLPNELLVKVIEKLPRPQWPAMELIDRKFRDATLLAWGSLREVDMERDFIYSESKTIKTVDEKIDPNFEMMVKGRLRHQIAQKTEVILKNLSERSPFITSLIGVSLIRDDSTLNMTAVQYLAKLEHLETIKFAWKYFRQIVNGGEFLFWCGIPLINFIEFIESTQSRAALKEIDLAQCYVSPNVDVVAHSERLRAAFAYVPPMRQLLRLETFSMRIFSGKYILTFFDGIDASIMTKLSLGCTAIEPAALTTMINRAPQLRHLDFAFLRGCEVYANTPTCHGGRQQPNKELLASLESHQHLTSLGLNSIWNDDDCACKRFKPEFKKMLQTIAPRLINLVFNPKSLPPDISMGEIRDIIQIGMPQLKSITLGERCTWNPEELRGIVDGKELEEIEFTAIVWDRHILNEVLSTLMIKSPRLKRFIGVNYYPDQRMAVELCKLSDLIDLRIDASQLTEENFVAFSQQVFAEKLEVLHLDWIREGGESGLIELIKKSHLLRELVVEGFVSNRLLECLADSCPNLEKFITKRADGITIEAVQLLVDRCPKLRRLGMSNSMPWLSLKDLKLERYRKLELE